jgi:hypothetical protein
MSPMGDSDTKNKNKATVPIDQTVGNDLFEKAVAAVGLDRGTTRWLFVSVLHAIGADPISLTAEDLGNVLQEVDRRIRQLVQPKQADEAMARLYRVMFDQAGPE